MYDSPGSIPWN